MSDLTALALAVVIGGAGACGILLMLVAVPRWNARSLSVRLAPYVRGAVPDERLPRGAVPQIGPLPVRVRSLWERTAAILSRVLGGDETISLRLSQAGREDGVAAFRGRQLLAALVGFAAGAVLVTGLMLSGTVSAPLVVLPVLGAVGGALLSDAALTSRARARIARLGEEIPTALEFLGLCLAAGEGLFDGIRRVAGVGSGELTREFGRVVIDVDTGEPLAQALQAMAARLQSPQLSRAVDQIVAALERGAPLAEVLQSQARDAREDAKRQLMEQAGRKEIAMMLPLVFLILPLSVLFAVFPGLFLLQIGLG